MQETSGTHQRPFSSVHVYVLVAIFVAGGVCGLALAIMERNGTLAAASAVNWCCAFIGWRLVRKHAGPR